MTTPGRPTGYRPEFVALARNYCRLGATNAQLADFFKVTRRTIDNWIVNFPEFGRAVRETRIVADERMWRAVYQCGIGYNVTLKHTVFQGGEERTLKRTIHKPPNMRAAMIWFRNRSKWVAATDGAANDVPGGTQGSENPYEAVSGEEFADPGVGPDPAFGQRWAAAPANDSGGVDPGDPAVSGPAVSQPYETNAASEARDPVADTIGDRDEATAHVERS